MPFVAGVTRTASGVVRNIQLSRPNPNFGSISVTKSIGEQWYHRLLVEARKRLADGFQAHASYTWAKAENLSGQASFAGGAESPFGGSQVANQFDLASNKGLAPTDQRQRLVMDGVWNLPPNLLRALDDNPVICASPWRHPRPSILRNHQGAARAGGRP